MKPMIRALVVLSSFALGCTQVLAAAPQGQAGQTKARGQACNVTHAAKTYACRSITGNPRGPWWVIVNEGAYKTCGASDNPDDTCKEKPKATHTIKIFRDRACTLPTQTITVDELRCN